MNDLLLSFLQDHKQSNMGGHDAGNQHQFTGIAKYFNSYTITGRRNVSCVQLDYKHTFSHLMVALLRSLE